MIAEGLSLALVAWCLSALALAFGVYRGARGLIGPRWAQQRARLRPDADAGGGFSEFRAAYGGAIFGLHALALYLALGWIFNGGTVVGTAAIGAAAVIAASWFGAAFGRLLSMLRDSGARTKFNRRAVGVEIVMFIAVGAPWLLWLLGVDG